MKNSGLIQTQLKEVTTIQNLTAALEGVASIRIAKIKDRVLPGRECFEALWQTYSDLRVDADRHKRFISTDKARFSKKNRPLFVIITSEGNLSGTIDQKIVDLFMADLGKQQGADVVALGSHGASLLEQLGIKPVKVFPLPDLINQVEAQQIVSFIEEYTAITVYYQAYVSLSQQVVRTIELISAVATLGAETSDTTEVISSRDYIFEPSLKEIIKIMEATMLQIALREVILDSHLAQLASRFSAMVVAEDKALKRRKSLYSAWHKAKRDESDKQQRENVTVGGAI